MESSALSWKAAASPGLHHPERNPCLGLGRCSPDATRSGTVSSCTGSSGFPRLLHPWMDGRTDGQTAPLLLPSGCWAVQKPLKKPTRCCEECLIPEQRHQQADVITGIVPDGIRERCAAAACDVLGAAAVGVHGAPPKRPLSSQQGWGWWCRRSRTRRSGRIPSLLALPEEMAPGARRCHVHAESRADKGLGKLVP